MLDVRMTIAEGKVLDALRRLGVDMQAIARKEVRAYGLDLVQFAKQAAPVKTGKLRRSINAFFTSQSGVESGVVGPNVVYARMVEEGFVGTENVRTFMRRQTKAWGKDIGERMVNVRAHTRNVNRKAQPYLAPAVARAQPLSDRIKDALSKLQITG
jgi:phage gpG-like protein